jgi:hypothetical protein
MSEYTDGPERPTKSKKTPKRFIADGQMFKCVTVESGHNCSKQVTVSGKAFPCAFSEAATPISGKHTRICQACDTTYCSSTKTFVAETNKFVKAVTWLFVPNITSEVDKYYGN